MPALAPVLADDLSSSGPEVLALIFPYDLADQLWCGTCSHLEEKWLNSQCSQRRKNRIHLLMKLIVQQRQKRAKWLLIGSNLSIVFVGVRFPPFVHQFCSGFRLIRSIVAQRGNTAWNQHEGAGFGLRRRLPG